MAYGFPTAPTFEKPWDDQKKSYGASWQRWFQYVKTALIPGQATGTATNDNATSGNVGEYIYSSIAVAGAVSLTTATTANVTSISLTPGDWDVSGVIDLHPAGSTTLTFAQGGSSGTSATLGSQDSYFSVPLAGVTSSTDLSLVVPVFRRSLAATTTVYLVVKATFATSTLSAYGTIRARRVR